MKKYFALLLLLVFASCVRLKEIPIQASFQGISNKECYLNPMNLLIVHGLGGYSEGDPQTLVCATRRKLKLIQVGDSVYRHIFKDGKYYGYLVYTDYEGPLDLLRIYNLYWYPTTSIAKLVLQDIDDENSSNRIKMIKEIKQNNVNNTASDVILYVSNFRKEIQYPFEKTFEWIVNERCGQDVTVVGFSLGSSIVIDTLDEMGNREIAANFSRQIKEIFMLSNPTPLFDLAKWNIIADQISWDWKSLSLGRFVFEKRKYCSDFKIIAISDPNDALSYIANTYIPSDFGWENAYQNVQVRNVKWSFFGLVNPMKAHTGYGKNKKVLDLIIYGSE